MIDGYEYPWGAHRRVPKVQKWQKIGPWKSYPGPCLTILGHSGPLDKAPGRHSPLSFSTTLPILDQFNKNGNLLTE